MPCGYIHFIFPHFIKPGRNPFKLKVLGSSAVPYLQDSCRWNPYVERQRAHHVLCMWFDQVLRPPEFSSDRVYSMFACLRLAKLYILNDICSHNTQTLTAEHIYGYVETASKCSSANEVRSYNMCSPKRKKNIYYITCLGLVYMVFVWRQFYCVVCYVFHRRMLEGVGFRVICREQCVTYCCVLPIIQFNFP